MGARQGERGFRRFRRPRMPDRLPARRLVWIVVAAVLFYLLVLSDFGLLRRWRLARETSAFKARLEELDRRQLDLERRRGEIGDDAALERIAREEYGMVRSGEHVYRLASPDTTGR